MVPGLHAEGRTFVLFMLIAKRLTQEDTEVIEKVRKLYDSAFPANELHNPEKRNGCSASSVRRSALAER